MCINNFNLIDFLGKFFRIHFHSQIHLCYYQHISVFETISLHLNYYTSCKHPAKQSPLFQSQYINRTHIRRTMGSLIATQFQCQWVIVCFQLRSRVLLYFGDENCTFMVVLNEEPRLIYVYCKYEIWRWIIRELFTRKLVYKVRDRKHIGQLHEATSINSNYILELVIGGL